MGTPGIRKKHLWLVLVSVMLLAGCAETTSFSSFDDEYDYGPVWPPDMFSKLLDEHDYDVKKTGIDFTPILECAGNIETEKREPKFDDKQRLIEYTKIVNCKKTGKSYTLRYSNFKYAGYKPISYEEEMICESLNISHSVVYRNIKYDNDGVLASYWAVLDGSESKSYRH